MRPVDTAGAVPFAAAASRDWAIGRASLVCLAVLPAACNGSFDRASKIESVRVLAIQADRPFARPGDEVTLKMVAYDGRPNPAGRAMHLFWVPRACVDPQSDLYYACFSGPGNPFAGLPAGADLSSSLTGGDTFSFQLPSDAIDRHPAAPSGPAYGLAVVFSIACAGHVELVQVGPNPQDAPIGCFDDSGARLGPSEYVLAFTRVYVYRDLTNSNPVIASLLLANQAVDPDAGIALDRCTSGDRSNCPKLKIDTAVPPSSQEDDPLDPDVHGAAGKERIWVDYYATGGDFGDDVRLLYDSRSGRVSGSDTTYSAQANPGSGFLWAVVHDNRGGVGFWQVPLTVR